jgi:hypothetical protein
MYADDADCSLACSQGHIGGETVIGVIREQPRLGS